MFGARWWCSSSELRPDKHGLTTSHSFQPWEFMVGFADHETTLRDFQYPIAAGNSCSTYFEARDSQYDYEPLRLPLIYPQGTLGNTTQTLFRVELPCSGHPLGCRAVSLWTAVDSPLHTHNRSSISNEVLG